ncbi:TetR/AcrR family transcriptional regulator [Streptomyces griseomycini]|uniref:AcrR family transcriptional regulator n=1 Tax=Streptomyces griseomycini TaxID=66895 RepID=A0A7W7M1P9_9ACTN|nr:TetR/AcrR family transcriptional regulator [Streptomyces griseomycini]MBB4900535.1 AcrR family transcriptional regulator [Streptomyces griseomycini]GGQ01829.1 TetR family transcriptional regulator [Streptomyces griseomycini]GGR11292.1 TetR family transcriptional regulator [Streptomyces griseomycini]
MNISQQPAARPGARGAERSLARRAELIAIGRRLFADTSYDALSMDDIARQARVAKGLIYYYFHSKRGYYLAIIQDSVADLVASAASGVGLPPVERVHRTVDGYLRYAEDHQAAYRTIVSGGVGFDAEVQAIRDGVREAIVATIAEGAYGRTDIAPLARAGLLSWVCGLEGAVLDWIGRPGLPREAVCELLVKTLGGALRAIEELDPAHPAPEPARRDS